VENQSKKTYVLGREIGGHAGGELSARDKTDGFFSSCKNGEAHVQTGGRGGVLHCSEHKGTGTGQNQEKGQRLQVVPLSRCHNAVGRKPLGENVGSTGIIFHDLKRRRGGSLRESRRIKAPKQHRMGADKGLITIATQDQFHGPCDGKKKT